MIFPGSAGWLVRIWATSFRASLGLPATVQTWLLYWSNSCGSGVAKDLPLDSFPLSHYVQPTSQRQRLEIGNGGQRVALPRPNPSKYTTCVFGSSQQITYVPNHAQELAPPPSCDLRIASGNFADHKPKLGQEPPVTSFAAASQLRKLTQHWGCFNCIPECGFGPLTDKVYLYMQPPGNKVKGSP